MLPSSHHKVRNTISYTVYPGDLKNSIHFQEELNSSCFEALTEIPLADPYNESMVRYSDQYSKLKPYK